MPVKALQDTITKDKSDHYLIRCFFIFVAKSKTMWFEKLTGFKETSPSIVRSKLLIEGDSFVSKTNGRKMAFGRLEIVTLDTLRLSGGTMNKHIGTQKVSEVVGDVRALHTDSSNRNALFQAASQFNLLEMVGPDVTPESGIDRYENDHTQGPACAIACGSGTIYRNYFAEVSGRIGQTADSQIDCLDLMGEQLCNPEHKYWTMKNGYAMMDTNGLMALNEKLVQLTTAEREHLKGRLKVGIQWNTEVTDSNAGHRVSQVYCSALPVAYCSAEKDLWESFARIILEATYEATLWAAFQNLETNHCNLVFLTLVGGGAFGNRDNWILDSIRMALDRLRDVPLDIRLVSYGFSNTTLAQLMTS